MPRLPLLSDMSAKEPPTWPAGPLPHRVQLTASPPCSLAPQLADVCLQAAGQRRVCACSPAAHPAHDPLPCLPPRLLAHRVVAQVHIPAGME